MQGVSSAQVDLVIPDTTIPSCSETLGAISLCTSR